MKQKRQGTIQVYTGNGKGKTTAALGLALRALGHGMKVLMVQFMKGSKKYGEVQIASKLPGFTLRQYGRNRFVKKGMPDPVDIELAQRGLNFVRRAIRSSKYDIIILDEANVAVDYGLINPAELLEIARNKPDSLELVFTGRGAPRELINIADTVSEVKEIKHHYRKGIPARAGIEY